MDTARNLLRLGYMLFAVLLTISGLFWSLQGAGIIMWPKESFMLADPAWIRYGLITAAFGAGLFWVLRGVRR